MSIPANYILCIVFPEGSLTTVIKIQDVFINWPEIPKNVTYRNTEANTQRCNFAHQRKLKTTNCGFVAKLYQMSLFSQRHKYLWIVLVKPELEH